MSRGALRDWISEKMDAGEFARISTVNPEFLVAGERDEEFRKILNESDANICDGAGISGMSRIFLGQKIERIAGVEVAEMVCEIAAEKGKSVAFLGGFGVAEKAAATQKKKFLNLKIFAAVDGEKEQMLKILEKNGGPDCILVAFGAPAQEKWLARFASQMPNLRLGIGVGGTFDFWAGKVRRAPKILQRLGLEWLFRLICEPRKRARRIANAVLVFPFLFFRSGKK